MEVVSWTPRCTCFLGWVCAMKILHNIHIRTAGDERFCRSSRLRYVQSCRRCELRYVRCRRVEVVQLHQVAHASWDGSALCRSCTTYHNSSRRMFMLTILNTIGPRCRSLVTPPYSDLNRTGRREHVFLNGWFNAPTPFLRPCNSNPTSVLGVTILSTEN